jgi:hypothetical protein
MIANQQNQNRPRKHVGWPAATMINASVEVQQFPGHGRKFKMLKS